MKRILIFSLAFFSIHFTSSAQGAGTGENKLSLREEMEMTSAPGDTTAEAYVLSDLGISKFINSGGSLNIMHIRTRRIKILKSHGSDWADVVVPLYREGDIYEKITQLEGKTSNLVDGKLIVTPLDPASALVEKTTKQYSLYKFSMPQVKVGSVLEYTYTFETPYMFNLPSWDFQGSIPVRYSEYRCYMVPFYEYSFVLKGADKFDYYKSEELPHSGGNYGGFKYNEMLHTYVMKNLPAFRDEAYITTPGDYMISLNFQLSKVNYPSGGFDRIMTSWPELQKDMLQHESFGKFLKSCASPAKEMLSSLELDGKSEPEKMQLIVDAVKAGIAWNSEESRYSDQSVKELLKRRSGNCTELNLFLVAILREAGFSAQPVLISTRDHGKVYRDYPFLHFFNYTVCLVSTANGYLLTDATRTALPYNKIPPDCMNDIGLVIKKEGEEWVQLNEQAPSVQDTRIQIIVHPETGILNCRSIIKGRDYDAYRFRTTIGKDEEKFRVEYQEKGYSEIDSIEIRDSREIDKNEYVVQFTSESGLESAGNLFLYAPFQFEVLNENPLKQPIRAYPVDMTYPVTRNYSSVALIPEGYKVLELPAPLNYDNANCSVKYSATCSGNLVVVTGSYSFKKSLYEPSEYKLIRYMFSEITKTFNKKIVLQKNS